MILIIGTVLLIAYVVAAAAAARHGTTRLWSTAAIALVLAMAGGILLGWYFEVPSMGRLLLAVMALAGPIVVFATVLLSWGQERERSLRDTLPLSMAGAVLGLACGWVIVVFGIGVW